jgi:hypothetical protein
VACKSLKQLVFGGALMAMLIEKDAALETVGEDRLSLLRFCLTAAWETWETHIRSHLPLCSPTGLANILHELVIQEVRERFGEIPGVSIRENNVGGRFLLQIDQTVILQFKKLTKDFRTANNRTDTSEAFDNQESLDGLPELPRLTVGYQLHHYGTSFSIWLAFLIGKECIWHHDLATNEGSITLEFPATSGQSAAEQEAADEEERERRESDDDEGSAEPKGA